MTEELFRLGALDVGSNTLRLLVADAAPEESRLRNLRYLREITRLGTGLAPGGALNEDAVESSLKTLSYYARVLEEERAAAHRGVATGAVRAARDGREFVARVKRETGLDIEIISGEEEARLSLKGVAAGLGGLEEALVFDVGGATTELVFANRGRIKALESIRLGVVGLTEKHLISDPPTEEEVRQIYREVEEGLKKLPREFSVSSDRSLLVGTAGTPSTLAAMRLGLKEYQRELVDGLVLDLGWLEGCLKRLVGFTRDARRGIPGLEPGREDIIIAGLALVIKLMEFFGFAEMVVSEAGLLEGVLIRLKERIYSQG